MGPLIEVARGPTDGTNRDFYLSSSYSPGSTVVFLNGSALRKDWDNGWIEYGSNHIVMREAPLTGDTVQVYYLPL